MTLTTSSILPLEHLTTVYHNSKICLSDQWPHSAYSTSQTTTRFCQRPLSKPPLKLSKMDLLFHRGLKLCRRNRWNIAMKLRPSRLIIHLPCTLCLLTNHIGRETQPHRQMMWPQNSKALFKKGKQMGIQPTLNHHQAIGEIFHEKWREKIGPEKEKSAKKRYWRRKWWPHLKSRSWWEWMVVGDNICQPCRGKIGSANLPFRTKQALRVGVDRPTATVKCQAIWMLWETTLQRKAVGDQRGKITY